MKLSPMPAYPVGLPAFVDLLKSREKFVPNWESDLICSNKQLDARKGIAVNFQFHDPEKLLESAVKDLNLFLNDAGCSGDAVQLDIAAGKDFDTEEYLLTVDEKITLESGDTEGIRRGIYALIDLISASPLLEKGVIRRKPWVKNRISRCFFGPIKRPPFNIDELMNDIDYYPEEYLSKLAKDGINGLWLTIVFREICDTSIRKAPADAERRIAKLCRTVERCRRYGIKVWVFCIEPTYWAKAAGNPLPEGCEELLGPELWLDGVVMNSFCPKSETAKKYLYECSNSLFSKVPHLGGMLFISLGERLTSCLGQYGTTETGGAPCPDCDFGPDDILSNVLRPLRDGMRDANPHAEMISWLYLPYEVQMAEWIYKIPRKLTDEITLAMNFESGYTREQQGKPRAGGDYWLSQVGPSDRFGRMAEAARGHSLFGAKMQVACSHETATVPYIPVPGLLYRKYKAMKELGVSTVIQCWYFGNYPGLMNEAACKLSFEDFSNSEDEFLEKLAKTHWGKDHKAVLKAWKHFTEGYSNYPLDNRIQYYGPLHDGPVWPLHLKLSVTPLTRSWKPEQFPSGDAIGECLKQFDLYDLVNQVYEMHRNWAMGMEELKKVDAPAHELDMALAEALDIQISSAYHILKFYMLREALLNGDPASGKLLEELSKIVRKEMANSLRLAELCKIDPRLGYHSEAEVYKYFPEKLQWRAAELQKLLDTDFAEARKLQDTPEELVKFLMSDMDEPYRAGKVYETEKIRWSFDADHENIFVHLEFPGRFDCAERAYLYMMDPHAVMQSIPIITIAKQDCTQCENGWKTEVTIPRSKVRYATRFLFGVERALFPENAPEEHYNHKAGVCCHDLRLAYTYFYADKLSPVEL
jgi:hypothetical protein